MLSDEKQFKIVEDFLRENGKIQKFEEKNGCIKGRMMIVESSVPDNIDFVNGDPLPIAFEASFDFYDTTIGIALFTETKKAASGIWMTPQTDNAEKPSQEWVRFFIAKLLDTISKDGSYGTPIYSFITDDCDMTIYPSL